MTNEIWIPPIKKNQSEESLKLIEVWWRWCCRSVSILQRHDNRLILSISTAHIIFYRYFFWQCIVFAVSDFLIIFLSCVKCEFMITLNTRLSRFLRRTFVERELFVETGAGLHKLWKRALLSRWAVSQIKKVAANESQQGPLRHPSTTQHRSLQSHNFSFRFPDGGYFSVNFLTGSKKTLQYMIHEFQSLAMIDCQTRFVYAVVMARPVIKLFRSNKEKEWAWQGRNEMPQSDAFLHEILCVCIWSCSIFDRFHMKTGFFSLIPSASGSQPSFFRLCVFVGIFLQKLFSPVWAVWFARPIRNLLRKYAEAKTNTLRILW